MTVPPVSGANSESAALAFESAVTRLVRMVGVEGDDYGVVVRDLVCLTPSCFQIWISFPSDVVVEFAVANARVENL